MYFLQLLFSALVLALIATFYDFLIRNFGHNFIQDITSTQSFFISMFLSILTVVVLPIMASLCLYLHYQYNKSYKKWSFPDKNTALEYVGNKQYLDISDENKSKLAILLFFSWKIEDDSDLGNVILKRGDEVKNLNLKYKR